MKSLSIGRTPNANGLNRRLVLGLQVFAAAIALELAVFAAYLILR